jgi:hypothetical protein
MESLTQLAVAVLIIVGILKFRELTKVPAFSIDLRDSVGHYRKKESVMNKSEQAYFYELKKQLPEGYHIFPNMRIADMINAVDGKGFYNRRNKILPKHIDFLVCDRYFKPVVAIEVNGSSHRRADRIERDDQVKRIFAEAKLPLEWVDVGTNFNSAVARIQSYLLS